MSFKVWAVNQTHEIQWGLLGNIFQDSIEQSTASCNAARSRAEPLTVLTESSVLSVLSLCLTEKAKTSLSCYDFRGINRGKLICLLLCFHIFCNVLALSMKYKPRARQCAQEEEYMDKKKDPSSLLMERLRVPVPWIYHYQQACVEHTLYTRPWAVEKAWSGLPRACYLMCKMEYVFQEINTN